GGVCVVKGSGGVCGGGVNEQPRLFRRAFSLRPKSRFIRGVGGPALSRRDQRWTAGRVCTLFSFRNDPPEESRSPCVARARGELGDGICFRTCSRGVGATGVNEPPRFFRRTF